jgi:hypothetical protein
MVANSDCDRIQNESGQVRRGAIVRDRDVNSELYHLSPATALSTVTKRGTPCTALILKTNGYTTILLGDCRTIDIGESPHWKEI